MRNTIFPHKFWRPFLDCMPQLFFRPNYVWFSVHLKGPMIPDPSGQLTELIVQITSTRVDLYSHQILLVREICRKQPKILPLNTYLLGSFVKNWHLTKDFTRKIHCWLRNFCKKYTIGWRIWAQKLTLARGTPVMSTSVPHHLCHVIKTHTLELSFLTKLTHILERPAVNIAVSKVKLISNMLDTYITFSWAHVTIVRSCNCIVTSSAECKQSWLDMESLCEDVWSLFITMCGTIMPCNK